MKKHGFTLIELLVVISIIAVLMAVLMPSLRAARDHAKRMHCASNVRTLSLAWGMYSEDFDYRLVNPKVDTAESIRISNKPLPWALVPEDEHASVEEKTEALKAGALYPYVGKSVAVYRCPADQRLRNPYIGAFRTYSIMDGAAGGSWPSHVSVKRLTEITRPAEHYIFVEDYDPRGVNMGSWTMFVEEGAWLDPLAIWHNRRSTLGFADGHVEIHPWHDTTFLAWCRSGIDTPGSFVFEHSPPP
ncbi:MAG: prepilin-type N-terminal cleavage/methylation domain-containing protein, partial [Sedimentisphaerales bacterium]|nr:prepilin-type N-terminal cleavage/methylation domain-containing protein [Sedimentisphaerales bacterium]